MVASSRQIVGPDEEGNEMDARDEMRDALQAAMDALDVVGRLVGVDLEVPLVV
jgi:hypothetical protein